MDTLKQSLEKLIQNTAVASDELFATILNDASVFEKCDDNIPSLLRDVAELRMDVKFILVDLYTIISACLATEKPYEKRYHLKNLYAGMLESFKLLYGFGKRRKRTVWDKINTDLHVAIQNNPNSEKKFRAIKERYDEITQLLLAIKALMTNEDNRNLTYHYDDDLLLVYRLTLETNCEEEGLAKYLFFTMVIRSMLEVCNQIEETEVTLGNVLPEADAHHDEGALDTIRNSTQTLATQPGLPRILSETVDRGVKQLDNYAKYKKDIITVEEFVRRITINNMEIPGLGPIKDLLDIQMLVSFMKADMSTILRCFIRGDSREKYSLTLRRMTISRVSTLSHLIGYNTDDSDSMWNRVISLIPSENQGLREEAEKIKVALKGIRKQGDCERRAIYVHMIDNKKYKSNIPLIMRQMVDVSMLSELQASQDLIRVCGQISPFLVKLLSAQTEISKKSRIGSEGYLKMHEDDLRYIVNLPNCPQMLKDVVQMQIDELEQL